MIDIGGGLPEDYDVDDGPPAYSAYVSDLRHAVPELFDSGCTLVTEFGRHVHAMHSIVATREEYTWRSSGRSIATGHAGADLFVRTAYLPDTWRHRVTVHSANGTLKSGETSPWDIAGPLCFLGDLIARDRMLPAIEPGDWLVVHDAGAYTLSMWSRYNSRQSPAVHGWSDDEGWTVLRVEETIDDVLAFWGEAGAREGRE